MEVITEISTKTVEPTIGCLQSVALFWNYLKLDLNGISKMIFWCRRDGPVGFGRRFRHGRREFYPPQCLSGSEPVARYLLNAIYISVWFVHYYTVGVYPLLTRSRRAETVETAGFSGIPKKKINFLSYYDL